jgi:hypothetical protein
MRRVTVLAFATVWSLGCGSGSGGMSAFTPNESEKQTATAMATQASSLQDLRTTESPSQGQQKVSMLGYTSQTAFSNQQGRNDGTAKSALAAATSALSEDDPCITRTETRITYDQCVSGTLTTDGFIDMAGDTFTIDLSGVSVDEATATFDYEGAITVTATAIDGSFRYKVDSRQGTSFMKYDITTTWNQVVLADGCPVGGVLTIDGTLDVNFEGLGSGSDSAAVEVTFGPTCGEMSMIGG